MPKGYLLDDSRSCQVDNANHHTASLLNKSWTRILAGVSSGKAQSETSSPGHSCYSHLEALYIKSMTKAMAVGVSSQ